MVNILVEYGIEIDNRYVGDLWAKCFDEGGRRGKMAQENYWQSLLGKE
jgi:hypothetical protein